MRQAGSGIIDIWPISANARSFYPPEGDFLEWSYFARQKFGPVEERTMGGEIPVNSSAHGALSEIISGKITSGWRVTDRRNSESATDIPPYGLSGLSGNRETPRCKADIPPRRRLRPDHLICQETPRRPDRARSLRAPSYIRNRPPFRAAGGRGMGNYDFADQLRYRDAIRGAAWASRPRVFIAHTWAARTAEMRLRSHPVAPILVAHLDRFDRHVQEGRILCFPES